MTQTFTSKSLILGFLVVAVTLLVNGPQNGPASVTPGLLPAALAEEARPSPASDAPSSVQPVVAITSPGNNFATNSGTVQVAVAFSAKLEHAKPAGNVKAILLKLEGNEVQRRENPPNMKSGTALFTVDLSGLLDGQFSLAAEAYQGSSRAGLVGSHQIVGILDRILPFLRVSAEPTPNVFGWIGSAPVLVHFEAEDNAGGSGIEFVSPDVLLTVEGANQKVIGTARDRAGNSASAEVTVNLDLTPAVVVLSPGEGEFVNRKSPALVASYLDRLSGVRVGSLRISVDGVPVTDKATVLREGASVTVPLTDGEHTWEASVEDLAGHVSSARARFTVSTSEEETSLRGRVSSTSGASLAGVPVRLAGVGSMTDANGQFQLPGQPGRRLLEVDGRPLGFAFLAELIDLEPGVNVLARDIFLPPVPLEEKGQTLMPGGPTILTNDDLPGVQVELSPASVRNPDGTEYTGKLMVLGVPLDRTPLALPADLEPDQVVAVQPGGLIFIIPARLTMPNRVGYPEGTVLNLWSLNPHTGVFEVVGKGRVQGGVIVTIEGGMIASAWHFFLPAAAELEPAQVPESQDFKTDWADAGSSAVSLISGDLSEEFRLPSVRFLDRDFAPRLVYRASQAFPRATLEADVDYQGTLKPNTAQDRAVLNGVSVQGAVRAVQPVAGNRFRIAHQVDLSQVASGFASVDLLSHGVYGQTGFPTAAVTSRTNFPVLVNNQVNSVFGAGWTLDLPVPGGFQRLLPINPSSVVILEGDGSSKLFIRGGTSVALLGNQVWVINQALPGAPIEVYDAGSLSLLKRIDLPPGGLVPVVVSINRFANKAVVLTSSSTLKKAQVHEIDSSTFTVRSGPVLQGVDLLASPNSKRLVVNARGDLAIPAIRISVQTSAKGLLIVSAAALDFERFIAIGADMFEFVSSKDQSTGWLLVGFQGLFGEIQEFDLNGFTFCGGSACQQSSSSALPRAWPSAKASMNSTSWAEPENSTPRVADSRFLTGQAARSRSSSSCLSIGLTDFLWARRARCTSWCTTPLAGRISSSFSTRSKGLS